MGLTLVDNFGPIRRRPMGSHLLPDSSHVIWTFQSGDLTMKARRSRL